MHISLGHKKQREDHIKFFEDALTSAFFGTLRYLPARVVVDLFISTLDSKPSAIQDALEELRLDEVSVEMNFWPNLANSGRVEPDLLITLLHPHGSRIDLLIECKWKSGASSDFQLLDQWQALRPDVRLNAYHVYLVRDLQLGHMDRNTNLTKASKMDDTLGQVWDERLFVVSWFDILKALLNLPINGLEAYPAQVVMQWKKDMAAMFERIGIRKFGGFKHLAGCIDASEGVVFWNPFRGFHQLVEFNICNDKAVVFFAKERSMHLTV